MALAAEKNILDEITDFLITRPTPEAIISFRLPEPLEQRAHELMQHNRDNSLTPQERIEMEEFMRLDHLMTLLKAKARLKRH
jgi:hypothetical protein